MYRVEPTSTPAAILILASHGHGMPAGGFGMLQRFEKCINAILGLRLSEVARVFEIRLDVQGGTDVYSCCNSHTGLTRSRHACWWIWHAPEIRKMHQCDSWFAPQRSSAGLRDQTRCTGWNRRLLLLQFSYWPHTVTACLLVDLACSRDSKNASM